MYFGYFLTGDANSHKAELCFCADKPGGVNSIVPISLLKQTSAGLFFVGLEECIRVEKDDQGILIIQVIRPGKIFLNPNRPEKPGFAVSKVSVQANESGSTIIHYDRDKGWEEFTPNKKDY